MNPITHQVHNSATITANANGNSVNNSNSDAAGGRTVSLIVTAGAAPTGTTPSLAMAIDVSADGTNWVQVGITTALTAAGTQRITATQIVEPYIRARDVVTGTTPSFTQVSAYLTIG